MTTAIERLRAAYHAGVLTGREVGAVEREVNALRADRDEARRDLSDAWAAIGPVMPTPASLAERIAAVRADRDRLAAALVDTINAIGNGSAATPGCSTDFLAHAPDEVRAAMARVRGDRDRLAARVAELEARARRDVDYPAALAPAARALVRAVDAYGDMPEGSPDEHDLWDDVECALHDLAAVLGMRVAGRDLERESAQREADLQSIGDRPRIRVRCGHGLAMNEVCRECDAATGYERAADEEPCPVDEATLSRWETEGLRRRVSDAGLTPPESLAVGETLAWLTRRVAGRGR